jgi:DNA-binding Xre family transcriptional regulator
MRIRSETRKIERTAAEKERLRALRAEYQKTKPTLEDLKARGAVVVPLGTYLAVQQLVADLRHQRQLQKLTLEQVAARAGMDKAALSRLETGKQPNPTVDSLLRIATALGMTIDFRLSANGAKRQPRQSRNAKV